MKLLQIIIPICLPMPSEGISGTDVAIGVCVALGLGVLIGWLIDKFV